MKGKPTPKQDKWKDPFFRNAIASRIGWKGMLKLWSHKHKVHTRNTAVYLKGAKG